MAGPSTEDPLDLQDLPAPDPAPRRVRIGDTVLVQIDTNLRRPLIVAEVHVDGSVSGGLICVDGDHERPGLRGWEQDGAQIQGRPSWYAPFAYGRLLVAGHGLGQWIR